MINELSKNINKEVVITLINGKEKSGSVVSIDVESNTIRLRDESNNSISILISMIGMIEPVNSAGGLVKPPIRQPENVPDNATIQQIDNHESLQKIVKIETSFDTEIKNATLPVVKPDFTTPSDILNLDVRSKPDELKKWNWIKDKYGYAIKVGRLVPNSDDLMAIIDKAKSLIQNPKLSNSSALRFYLGYFHYKNNNKGESLEAYMQAAKLSDKPQDWLNLASVASEKSENEIACYALEKLFLQLDCTGSLYEKAWYKFTELTIKYSVYNSFTNIINNTSRLLLKEEQQKIFEAVCYCLLKKEHRKIVETQIQNSLSNPDYKKLVSESLLVLPQYPVESYVTFKNNFDKVIENIIVVEKIITPRIQPEIKPKAYVTKRYRDMLKEARYARDTEKNYQKSEGLFIEGIEKEKDHNIKERAVRELANMLAQQMKEPKRAIQAIKKYQTSLSESDLNSLYNFYYQLGNYEEAIKIQKELLKNTNRTDARLKRYLNIAACYLKVGNYVEAENNYRNALSLNRSNYSINRNIALCLYKRGEIDEAKTVLKRIITQFGDPTSIQLLENFKNQNFAKIDDIIIDTAGLVFENLDAFTNFYLSSCDMKYVDKSRLSKEGKYIGDDKDKVSDIRTLENTADTLKRRIAESRSNVYLNAARILFDLGEINNEFYIYMCRCFTSKGDNAVESRNSPDTVKTFYLAALKVYDSLYFDEDKSKKSEFADAIKSLCRFIYSFLGRDKIPLTSVNIKDAIETVFNQHPDSTKIFDALCLIFARSPQYSISRVLKVIYENHDFKKFAHNYLGSDSTIGYESFIELWKDKARSIIKIENELSEQLSLLRNFELSEIWLSSGIDRINKVVPQVLFDSDKDYLIDLQKLLDLCISLCKADSFDEKRNKCDDIEQKAKSFIGKIEKNPTKLSIEEIYPIINSLLLALKRYQDELNQKSKPELIITSAIASYHLKENGQIELQVKIENTAEGHAEQVEFLIDSDSDSYELMNQQAVAYGTIRGQDKETQIIALRLNPKAIAAKAFTLKACAKFRTRQGESVETPLQEIPIQLGDAKDFVEIKPNPYAQWVRGKKVVDKAMFFGREEFIKRAYSAICNNYRSYVIYGQYRSGKSSILHHLEQELKSNPQILVAEIGELGRMMDNNSPTPLLYQILFGILRKIDENIRAKERNGLPVLDFCIPASQEFYTHPAPLDYFYELMDNLAAKKNEHKEWTDIRIIVTMDEFTDLYEKIIQGKLSDDFMKNWKALLATNYFNVVLVAQDVFPKFRNKYDNAFQTMQHERVTYLEEPDAKELIDRPIRIKIDPENDESRYTEQEAIDRICELTACSPYYIQIFCNQLVDYINDEKQPYITKANVNIVKDRLLRGNKRLDKTAFTNLINNSDPSDDAIPHSDLIKVLKKIAEHTKNDSYCSRNRINCEIKTDINEILKDLEDRDVIDKHGEKGFRIRVGLFKEWLNENPHFME